MHIMRASQDFPDGQDLIAKWRFNGTGDITATKGGINLTESTVAIPYSAESPFDGDPGSRNYAHTSDVADRFHQALDVAAMSALLNGLTACTIATICKVTTYAGGPGTFARAMFQIVDPATTGACALTLAGAGPYTLTGSFFATGDSTATSKTTAGIVTLGWHVAAVTWQLADPQLHLYLDGVDVGSYTRSKGTGIYVPDTCRQARWGCPSTQAFRYWYSYFPGLIASTAIYNTTKDADFFLNLYNGLSI